MARDVCTVGDEHYLFASGYSPVVGRVLQIGAFGETDITQRAREILALTKMNWNSSDGIGRHPVTVSFARKVGMLMAELSDNQTPNPSYRFYM